jgi:diacylglycerol kinase family enzyme
VSELFKENFANMARRVLVVLNAGSGFDDKRPIAKLLEETFAAAGLEASITVARGHDIVELARRAVNEGISLVVAGGGDGTISTIASVVAGTETMLGVLPLGTLNHFAKDLGIPMELDAAVQTIIGGQPVMVDMAEVNGRIFINNSSVGIYPRLVLDRERQRRRGRRKWLAFAVAVVRVWISYRRVHVTLIGQNHSVRTPFVFIGNNEYQMEGTELGGRSSMNAGCLHLCMAPGMTRFEVFRVLLAALIGRLTDLKHFESHCAVEFSIEALRRRRRPFKVSLDGEVAGIQAPLHYRIRPGALRVLVPALAMAEEE